MLTMETLEKTLGGIPSLRIGLIGDGCIDVYWEADMRLSELSREVPQHPLPIVSERFSLGAGANVLANLAALGAVDIQFIGCIGKDWRSTIFRQLLSEIQVSTQHLLASDEIVTPAYCKPIRRGISAVCYEDPRLDFINRKPIPAALEEGILAALAEVVPSVDLLIVCDQFSNGCITDKVIAAINEYGKELPILVDSRDRIQAYRNVIVKPNEVEACQCLGIDSKEAGNLDMIFHAAAALEQQNQKPVLITLGESGAVWCENGKPTHVEAYPVTPPIDFVGAGDSFLSGFSLAYALKLPPRDAVQLGCLISSITIQKIGTTGVAEPEEAKAALLRYLPKKLG